MMEWDEPRYEPPQRTTTVQLKVGPYNFGEVTLQGLIGSMRPRFEARADSCGYILNWLWTVPCRDTGRPIEVSQAVMVWKQRLDGMTRDEFIARHVHPALHSMITHELDESLVVDGKFYREPHP